jgi:hypothetical protein
MGNYYNFVKNYGKIAAPLTTLLKKNAFSLTHISNHSFQALKNTMFTTPIMALPDFKKTFVLECDTSGKGIGVVLNEDD